LRGRDTYELRKFNRADWLYISPGAWAEMRHARTVAIRMSPLSFVNLEYAESFGHCEELGSVA